MRHSLNYIAMMIKIKKREERKRKKKINKNKKEKNLDDFDYTCLINSRDYRHSVPIIDTKLYVKGLRCSIKDIVYAQ